MSVIKRVSNDTNHHLLPEFHIPLINEPNLTLLLFSSLSKVSNPLILGSSLSFINMMIFEVPKPPLVMFLSKHGHRSFKFRSHVSSLYMSPTWSFHFLSDFSFSISPQSLSIHMYIYLTPGYIYQSIKLKRVWSYSGSYI